MGEITKIKIFPSIGIMRVGNSPDEYFIGPEIPGHYELPEGGFKDAQCRIKRQAARFRLYGYDAVGSKPIEITAKDAEITWTVQLANKKASGPCIYKKEEETDLRNQWYTDLGFPRDHLNIRADPHSLIGANQGPFKFEGKFLKKVNGKYEPEEKITLGEMLTDELGRLLVLGGFGKSGGVEPPEGVEGYSSMKGTFNTPGWYDDVSDGPVTAKVKINGQEITNILPAWVICAPPAYAPQLSHLTTLYDALRQTALNKASTLPPELVEGLKAPDPPSFARDVLPILQRTLDLYWLTDFVKTTKPDGSKGGAYQEAHHVNSFKLGADLPADKRQKFFDRLKPPGIPPQAELPKQNMPLLWGDNYDPTKPPPVTVLTPTQYSIMKNWANPTWEDPPSSAPPPPFENPEDLTRAALESCVGGALVPGIEAGRFLRDECGYIEPFRLDHNFIKDGAKLEAGDITMDMALPWQGDFNNCHHETPYAWWPAQRPDDVFPDIDSANNAKSARWVRDIFDKAIDARLEMVQKWHQLGFVLREGDKFIEKERHSVCNDLFLILDRTHFSVSEAGNTFENCFYVVIEGFRPSDFVITEDKLSDDKLEGVAPKITLTLPESGKDTLGITAHPQALLFELIPFADKPQRLTFVYKIKFENTTDFTSTGNQTVTLKATKKHPDPKLDHTFSAIGELTLIQQPNPYMQDGPVTWLSEDVRVFMVLEDGKLLEDEAQFSIPFPTPEFSTPETGAKAACDFIDTVVDAFNKDPNNLESHPFEKLETDQAASQLVLAEKVKTETGYKRAFNFAIARVRYSGNLDAVGVRVFFRLFTTAATGLEYHESTTYRRSDDDNPVALLGRQAGNIVSIPCYGDMRADSEDKQTDVLNIKTLAATDKGETYRYFGCWLDFNQTTPRIPDPFDPTKMRSIQDQIRGLHQCLVAEIYLKDDPVAEGATPAQSDNLAQRNLMINQAPNPGIQESRVVHHTFEIQAAAIQNARPDELMIRWNNVPRTAQVTLYLPGVHAEVMRLAEQNYEARRLEPLDAHTIRCLPGDVTYVPLPTGRLENIPGLLSIELPEGIQRGQEFNLVVHQISGKPRRMLGAFQLNIPVSTKTALLEPEMHNLSVLRYIARSIPVGDRWYPVFVRYLDQIAGRVRGFGGDPDTVAPSPDGSGVGSGITKVASACTWLGWLAALVLALFILVAGLHPSPNYLPEVIVAVLSLAAFLLWAIKCGPSACRVLIACLVGLGVGAAFLSALWLAGFAQQQGFTVLALATLIFGVLIVACVLWGCLAVVEKQET